MRILPPSVPLLPRISAVCPRFPSLPEDVDKLVHYRFVQGPVRGGYSGNIMKSSKPMFTITWIPCSIPVRKMPDYVWGTLFLFCGQKMEQVDAVFSSMHFERGLSEKRCLSRVLRGSFANSISVKWKPWGKEYDSRQEEIQDLLQKRRLQDPLCPGCIKRSVHQF